LCSRDIQTRWTKGLYEISMSHKVNSKCNDDIPEAASVQLEVFFLCVIFDSCQSIAGRFLVICLLGGISALIGVGHCGRR
jgi:hypothetical protein